jgi:tetratricopeptide (TPR) repeat protein
VADTNCRTPILARFYRQYLSDEDAARFIKAVSERYTLATLERLARFGSPLVRRSAMLGLGFIASYESNTVLAQGLRDSDRGVRILAEDGIRSLWERAGSDEQRQRLRIIIRLNCSEQFEEAARHATQLIEDAPGLAEAWNQRAIAYYHLERYEDAAGDCLQTLELNAYHFAAMVRLGHCYLRSSDAFAALESFRRALQLYPDLEGVRAQVDYLQRTLEGR